MLTGVAGLDAGVFALAGLLVGSFINVVVYRLPKMLERQWAAECAQASGTTPPEQPALNLIVPRSRCNHCGHPIAWHENIPIASYLFLGGKCSVCASPISVRYPLVEATTAALFFYCGWTFGASVTGVMWCVFSAMLLALALIDWDTTLLPDDITLPLLWLGLVAAALQWTPTGLHSALWGAVVGYASLWSIYWAFKLITGKEGMGYGDFKLFAALGAWFGWQVLIPMILIASVIGAVVGLAMKFTSNLREGGYIPFGPFLALAGYAVLVLGPDTVRSFAGI
jgi:leader peptidase (prepilin peptidase)/N-methyltransferase